MRLHRVLPLCVLGLLGLPSPARLAPVGGPVPLPGGGEIRLDGLVTGARPSPKSLQMSVTTVTSAAGAITVLPAPRLKTILLTVTTRMTTADLTQRVFRDIHTGDVVSVIGNDSGPGKPLAARSVVVLLGR